MSTKREKKKIYITYQTEIIMKKKKKLVFMSRLIRTFGEVLHCCRLICFINLFICINVIMVEEYKKAQNNHINMNT